jgi:protocatechuate 3,4-dioxygenase beta subunit
LREQDGALVVLGRGDEPVVQIRMQRSPLVSLTGTVLRATGVPAAGAAVRVSTRNRLDVYGMTFRTDADGRFSVTDLIPGEYDLEASAPDPNQPEIQRAEFASATAVVGGGDAEVVLAMSRTARVAGHVTFEGAPAPAPAERRGLAIVASGPPRTPRADVARVQPDLTFVLDQLVGPQLLDAVGAPEGWVLKSVRYAGAELTDAPAEFRPSPDPRHLQVTLTRRAAALAGRVVDGAGSPLPHARVFLLPAEPQRWARVASEAMRVSDETGAFAFESRRPGEYLAVAVSEEDAPELPEPEDLELLARLAERVTLLEGERRAVTLRLVSVPEER